MLTIDQMQREMLERCEAQQDGTGWPKPYIRGFPPVLQIIRSQEQMDEVLRQDRLVMAVLAWIFGGVTVAICAFFLALVIGVV